jgi:transposase-like protein
VANSEQPKRKPGRPTVYREEYVRQAHNLCLLGATNPELARALGVSDSSIDKWIAEIPEFSSAVKAGREEADAKVASRLYARACGYEHEAVKIFADVKTGAEQIVRYTERYPPETVAGIFWLKNRQPSRWRDKQDHEHTGKDGGPVELAVLTPAERQARAEARIDEAFKALPKPSEGEDR